MWYGNDRMERFWAGNVFFFPTAEHESRRLEAAVHSLGAQVAPVQTLAGLADPPLTGRNDE